MKAWRSFLTLVSWEWAREMKRKETVLSMIIFSIITLMIFSFALSPDSETGVRARAGILWITFLTSGTIGIDRAFRGPGQANVLEGLLLSPVGRVTIYYGKMTATLLFVIIMEAVTFTAFCLLYNVSLGALALVKVSLLVLAGTIGMVSVGVTLSAMTQSLRGGDVLLRILLFPLLIPVFYAVVSATDLVLSGKDFGTRHLMIVGAFDLAYVAAGQILFEQIVSDYES